MLQKYREYWKKKAFSKQKSTARKLLKMCWEVIVLNNPARSCQICERFLWDVSLITVLRTGVPLWSTFCNHCTANSYFYCLYKEKNFLEWHSPAEYLHLNPYKIDLDSRTFLSDSSASPWTGAYLSNVSSPRDTSKNLPAQQEGKSLSLWETRWRREQSLSCTSVCSTFRFASGAKQPRDTSLIWNKAPVLTDFRLLPKM